MIDIDIDDDDSDDTLGETTTEPKVGAQPNALSPAKTKTVVMSQDEVRASHREAWPIPPRTEEPATVPTPIGSPPFSPLDSIEEGPSANAASSWHNGPLHPEDEAALESATPTSAGRKGLMIVALLAVTAISLIGAFCPSNHGTGETIGSSFVAESDGHETAITNSTGGTRTGTNDEGDPSPPPPPLDKGTSLPAFLKAPVERVHWDAESLDATIDDSYVVGDAIPKKKEKKVTVVNFWATWCVPCKQEMPGLKKMFEESGWGNTVRFVPIEADTTPPKVAYEEFAPLMPAHRHYLVGAKVLDALVADEVLEDDEGLPLTLLLDCKRRMRWIHAGELGPQHVVALKELIDELRGELSTKYCRVKPARSTAPTISPPPTSSDPPGKCGDAPCLRGYTCDRSHKPHACVPS